MTLATLHADVAAVLARGNSQAAKVPRWVRHSAAWLEQNYSFKYMEKHGEVELDPLAIAPNVLDLPNNRVKSVVLVQPFRVTGTRKQLTKPLPKADRRDVLSIDMGNPSGWWQVGNSLHFDGKPSQPFALDLVWQEYTDWPTEQDAQPDLLAKYENLLFAQTLVAAWRELKDAKAMQDWTNERDFCLRAVLVAEEEDKWEGQDLRMQTPDELRLG